MLTPRTVLLMPVSFLFLDFKVSLCLPFNWLRALLKVDKGPYIHVRSKRGAIGAIGTLKSRVTPEGVLCLLPEALTAALKSSITSLHAGAKN